MHLKTNNKGFSLIELSIVLIIMGLLISGVIAGSSLIETARVSGFINQIVEYKQSVNIFYSIRGRYPGDLNRDDKFGYNSNETYTSNDFAAPYDGSDSNYSIPNNLSAPFVELYLENLIDFKPKKSAGYNAFIETYNLGGLPSNKSLQLFTMFETYPPEAEWNANKVVIMNKTLPNTNIKWTTKAFRSLDTKLDDGVQNTGRVIASCYGPTKPLGQNTYEESQNYGCNWVSFILVDL